MGFIELKNMTKPNFYYVNIERSKLVKTLNREKSKDLFYRIKSLGETIAMLSGVVQNPDFVNEKVAQENYECFYNDYKDCLSKLKQIKEEVFELHNEILK